MKATVVTKDMLSRPAGRGPSTVRDRVATKLLGIGGERVLWLEPEPHAELLLECGRLFTGRVRMRRP